MESRNRDVRLLPQEVSWGVGGDVAHLWGQGTPYLCTTHHGCFSLPASQPGMLRLQAARREGDGVVHWRPVRAGRQLLGGPPARTLPVSVSLSEPRSSTARTDPLTQEPEPVSGALTSRSLPARSAWILSTVLLDPSL